LLFHETLLLSLLNFPPLIYYFPPLGLFRYFFQGRCGQGQPFQFDLGLDVFGNAVPFPQPFVNPLLTLVGRLEREVGVEVAELFLGHVDDDLRFLVGGNDHSHLHVLVGVGRGNQENLVFHAGRRRRQIGRRLQAILIDSVLRLLRQLSWLRSHGGHR